MALKTQKERRILSTILLGISAFTFVMGIVYAISIAVFGNLFTNGAITMVAFAITMQFGAFLGIGMNYTIRVPRGREGDFNQMIMWLILILLGTAICASMHIVQGNTGLILLLPIVFYVQNGLMFLIGLYSLKFYRKK